MAATRRNATGTRSGHAKARPKARPIPRTPRPRLLTRAQGRALFDSEARRRCGMSGAEFLRKWDADEFPDPDTPAIIDVALLIPFVR